MALKISERKFFFYSILFPTVIFIGFLTIYPVLNIFYLSFFKSNYIESTKTFIFFNNYINIFKESLFRRAFINTFVFSIVSTLFEVLFGFILAIIFYRTFKFKKQIMLLVILPMMISSMVVCAIWKTLYHYDIGLINYLLVETNIGRVGWLIDSNKALFSIILIDIWQWTPFAFLLIQAGLNSIPKEIIEASQLDGANSVQRIFKILTPMILDQLFLVLMLRTIDTFKLFGKVYALTQGGPGNATETLSYYIYREGFSYFNLGKSSTASIYTLFIVILISFIYIKKILKKDTL